jgi:hypothetical protein
MYIFIIFLAQFSEQFFRRTVIHYHIRWAGSKLDWEAFMTEKEAKEVAEYLKRPGENYAIEKADGHCQRCNQLKARRSPLRAEEANTAGDLSPG